MPRLEYAQVRRRMAGTSELRSPALRRDAAKEAEARGQRMRRLAYIHPCTRRFALVHLLGYA